MFKSRTNSVGNDALAYTFCGWQYEVSKSSLPTGRATVKITALFNEQKSWKKNGAVNDEILKHEQNHFDIAEIFARKLRKDIAEQIKTSADFDRKFEKLYQKRFKEYRDFQERYDGETRHGTNLPVQQKYNLLVEDMLKESQDFAL